MTKLEQQIIANNYYCRAMQMFDDYNAGRTEFVRQDEVFDLLYNMASDFEAIAFDKM